MQLSCKVIQTNTGPFSQYTVKKARYGGEIKAVQYATLKPHTGLLSCAKKYTGQRIQKLMRLVTQGTEDGGVRTGESR